MNALYFLNYTSEDFTHSYDGNSETFKAGEGRYLEDFRAHLFAKHLVDRELNRKNLVTNDMTARAEIEALCFPAVEAVPVAQALDIEEKKKVSKKAVKEEEFPGLETE